MDLNRGGHDSESDRSQTDRSQTHRELARRLAEGDPEAWRDLCQAYGQALFAYAYHRTGHDPSVAEDVRQDTLLAAVERIGSYRGEVPVFAWLCGIARHKAADRVRLDKRRGLPLEALGEETPRSRSPAAAPRVVLGPGGQPPLHPLPDEALERAETRSAVVEAVWTLPADYRRALLLRYVEGEGVGAVAARLGRSYKATESLLARARDAFRRRLREVELDE